MGEKSCLSGWGSPLRQARRDVEIYTSFPNLPQKVHITTKPSAAPFLEPQREDSLPPHRDLGELSKAPEGQQSPAPAAAHEEKELRDCQETKASPDFRWDPACSQDYRATPKDDTPAPLHRAPCKLKRVRSVGKSAGPETIAARRPMRTSGDAGDARSYLHSLGGSGATAGNHAAR